MATTQSLSSIEGSNFLTCLQNVPGGTGNAGSTPPISIAEKIAGLQACSPGTTPSFIYTIDQPFEYISGTQLRTVLERKRKSNGTIDRAGSITISTQCFPAPPPPSCDIESRERFQAVFPDDQHPEQLCDGSNTCEMKIEQRLSGFGTSLGGGSTGFSIYQYRNTGAACTTGTPSVSELEEAAAINQPNAGSHEVETDAAPQQTDQDATKQCGYINGEKHCFQRNNLPSGGCITTQNGNAICTTSAPELPRDAQGNPVPPDVVITNNQADGSGTQGGGTGAGDTRNYYTQTTINNNLAAGGTGLGEGGGDGEGDGDGECDPETEECDGEGEGDGTCDPAIYVCPGDGTAGEFGELPEVRTIAESLSTLTQAFTGSDFGSAVSALSNLNDGSAGGCSNPSFTIWQTTFQIPACEFFFPYVEWLRAMFILGWAIAAVRVFLEA